MKNMIQKHGKWCSVCVRFAQNTLASGLSYAIKYAVGEKGLAGKGLTVIANKGIPAGQAILARSFPGGIAPLGLLGSRCRLQELWFKAFYVSDDVP
jgi:hypothetical protein